MKPWMTTAAVVLGVFFAFGARAEEEFLQGEAIQQQDQTDPAENIDSSRLSWQDRHWMAKASKANLFEIILGELAQKKSTEEIAKRFGQRMIHDHTRAQIELQRLARLKGIKLPEHPSSDQKVVISYFKQSDSPDWDHDYVEFEVADHEGDILETRKEIEKGKDREVREEARKVLVLLEEHLRLAKKADSELDPRHDTDRESDLPAQSSMNTAHP